MSFSRLSFVPLLGVAVLLSACREQRAQTHPRRTPPPANYHFGDVVSFGEGGRSNIYKRGGWGDVEGELTWTNGHSAVLEFVLPESERALRLRMRLAGFTNPPLLPYQRVEVFVNDEKMADWQVADASDFIAIIPSDVADHEKCIVELRLPDATSPESLELRADSRMLGVSCFELAITEASDTDARAAAEERAKAAARARSSEYRFGTVVSFALGGGAQRYKVSGWNSPEKEFTWTGKDPAVLEFTVPPSEDSLTLWMKLSGFIAPPKLPFQVTQVLANGRQIAEWKVAYPAEFSAAIPHDLARTGGKLRIELRVPGAASPKSLGQGEDERTLGVRCEAVAITEGNASASGALTIPTPRPRPESR